MKVLTQFQKVFILHGKKVYDQQKQPVILNLAESNAQRLTLKKTCEKMIRRKLDCVGRFSSLFCTFNVMREEKQEWFVQFFINSTQLACLWFRLGRFMGKHFPSANLQHSNMIDCWLLKANYHEMYELITLKTFPW